MARGIDHLVLPVRDLEAARDFYARLGFTLTPRARHPWGTENSLVQFPGSFLELLSIADASLIPESSGDFFSFGAFNRDFLEKGEGASMLVLESADEAADRAAFAAAGLPTFAPFRFERRAQGPDGSERTVAFSLTFTACDVLPGVGFFTCRQHLPENFWSPALQVHPNGARGIAAVVLRTPEPFAAAQFLSAFADAPAQAVAGGAVIDTGRGTIRVLTQDAGAAEFGLEALPAGHAPRLSGFRIAVHNLDALRARLGKAGVRFAEGPAGPVIAARDAFGAGLSFCG
jgi:catechol 2,3-dioxygenase-like lactoylglutathione lyase family enzyme